MTVHDLTQRMDTGGMKLHDQMTHSREISMQAGLIADGNNTGTSLIQYFQPLTRKE